MPVVDDPPLRLSWSRLRNHAECPAKGQLLSARKKSPIADIRGYFHGTVVDICMRRWLSQDDPQLGQMLAWVDEIFDKAEVEAKESGDGIVKWKHAGDKAEIREFCRECVRRLEPLLQRVALPYVWDPAIRFSVPFTIPDENDEPRELLLVGEMDLLVEMPGRGVIIWDLKATKDAQYWRKVKGQLVFYAIVSTIMRSREVPAPENPWPLAVGLLQPMCEHQDPVFELDQDDYSQMFARITNVAREIWAGKVHPKVDNTGCRYCDVRGACPKFSGRRGRVGLGTPAVSPA